MRCRGAAAPMQRATEVLEGAARWGAAACENLGRDRSAAQRRGAGGGGLPGWCCKTTCRACTTIMWDARGSFKTALLTIVAMILIYAYVAVSRCLQNVRC